jgi:hypothetical protein
MVGGKQLQTLTPILLGCACRFLQYIDRDPDAIARQKDLDRRNKADKDDETRQREVIDEMMRKDREAAAARGVSTPLPDPRHLPHLHGHSLSFLSTVAHIGANRVLISQRA